MSVIVTSFTEVLWIKFAYFDIRCTRRTCIGSSNLLFVFVHEHMLICPIINLTFWGDFLSAYSFFSGIDLPESII